MPDSAVSSLQPGPTSPADGQVPVAWLMAAGDTLSDALGILGPIVDEDGMIQDFFIRYANPAAAAFAGLPAVDLVGGRLLELAPKLKLIGMFDVLAEACEHGTPVEREIPIARPGRVDQRVIARARPVNGDMVVVIEDTTEPSRRRRDNEDRLETYRTIGAVTRDVLWQWDITTDRLQFETPDVTVFGRRFADGTSALQWWYEGVHPDDLPAFQQAIKGLTSGTADAWAGTYRFRTADGGYRRVFDRRQVVRDVDRRPVRMIGSLCDMSGVVALTP